MRSFTHRFFVTLWALLALAVMAAGPAAAGGLDKFGGHLAVGYGKLFADRAPAGSLSIAGGVEYPIASALRLGIDVGYDLLGTRTEEEGSLIAELDYGVFETLLLLHWTPPWAGPVGRVSVGPGLFNARADLSSSGPTEFGDLAVEQTVGGAAAAITLVSRGASPVRVGFELGVRVILLPERRLADGTTKDEDWTVASGRLTFHY